MSPRDEILKPPSILSSPIDFNKNPGITLNKNQ